MRDNYMRALSKWFQCFYLKNQKLYIHFFSLSVKTKYKVHFMGEV